MDFAQSLVCAPQWAIGRGLEYHDRGLELSTVPSTQLLLANVVSGIGIHLVRSSPFATKGQLISPRYTARE